ncbi:unnamed protein product [Urochloa humidicola]
MAEEAEAAVIAEAVAARARELVVALLAPGGLLSVEDAGKAVADRVRSSLAEVSPNNVATMRLEDVEKMAIKAATAALTILVLCRAGSLNAPHGVLEEAITKAVAAACAPVGDTGTISVGLLNALHGVVGEAITEAVAAVVCAHVRDMSTSLAYNFALRCLVVIFFLWVTTIAIFVLRLVY